jgi:hypothetical protein
MKFAKTLLAGALLAVLGTAQAASAGGSQAARHQADPRRRRKGRQRRRHHPGLHRRPDHAAGQLQGRQLDPPDPFANGKAAPDDHRANMAQYEGQLTAGTRALLKKYPKYRIDVYPTHRTVALPDRVLDNTVANATRASTSDGGLGISGAIGGYPFPIPKTGNEAMWNHLLRYVGVASNFKYDNWNVDSSGTPALATSGKLFVEYPYYDPKNTKPAQETDVYFRTKIFYNAPARRAGEA